MAVPTTVYHWLQGFQDLRWRGKPDRQIGVTLWQGWLQADAQRDTVPDLGPALATRPSIRKPRAARWRCTQFCWPTYPSPMILNLILSHNSVSGHFSKQHGNLYMTAKSISIDPAPEGAIRKSVPLPPARGATEPTKCPLCADKYYTSGAMLEHLGWHAVHAATPAEDKKAASHMLQGRARRSPVARLLRPAPPTSSGRPRGGPEGGRGGIRSGPGSRRCSPSGVHPRGTGPPGPPVGPPGSRLPALHGPGTARGPGCPSGPRGNASTKQLTPGGRGGQRPQAPPLEPAQRPRPTGPIPPGHTLTTPGAGGLYR